MNILKPTLALLLLFFLAACGKMTESKAYQDSFKKSYVKTCKDAFIKEVGSLAEVNLTEDDVTDYCQCALDKSIDKYPKMDIKSSVKMGNDEELLNEIEASCIYIISGDPKPE